MAPFTYEGHWYTSLNRIDVDERGNGQVHITFVVCVTYVCRAPESDVTEEELKKRIRYWLLEQSSSAVSYLKCYPYTLTGSIRFI